MSATANSYRLKKTDTVFDATAPSALIHYLPVMDGKSRKSIQGKEVWQPDKEFLESRSGMWNHQIYQDSQLSTYTLQATANSSEYDYKVPTTLHRIKRLGMILNAYSGNGAHTMAHPIHQIRLRIGDKDFDPVPREAINAWELGFVPEGEEMTNIINYKGFTSALACKTVTTTPGEERFVDLTPMLPTDLFTLGNPAEVHIIYQFDNVADCATTGTTIVVNKVRFIFTEFIEDDSAYAFFLSQRKGKVLAIPYLRWFDRNLGALDGTPLITTITNTQLIGRCPFMYFLLKDSATAINAVSHIGVKLTSIELLDGSSVNIFIGGAYGEATFTTIGVAHGLTSLYTLITHATPMIFCKNPYETMYNHINSGGLKFDNGTINFRALSSAVASGTLYLHTIGAYYEVIYVDGDSGQVYERDLIQ